MQILASLREAMSSSAKLLNPESDLWVDKQLLGALHSIVNLFTPYQYPSYEVFTLTKTLVLEVYAFKHPLYLLIDQFIAAVAPINFIRL